MSLKDQIEDARRAISGPVYYHYPPGASEALEVVCKSDYDALAARLAEAERLLRLCQPYVTLAVDNEYDGDKELVRGVDAWLADSAPAVTQENHDA